MCMQKGKGGGVMLEASGLPGKMMAAAGIEGRGGKKKKELKNEYTNILGNEKSDIAELIANQEFESFSGEHFYVPYQGVFGAGAYDRDSKVQIGNITDSRNWKKNLLEIEKVENFTVGEQNFGEVFISKSEFSPTSYAIEGKWSPVYEYFTKNENGEFNFLTIGGTIHSKYGILASHYPFCEFRIP